MGLRMDDIHNPTVPSGPTTGHHANGINKDQLSLMQLIHEKERTEGELSALGKVLDSHGVNMNTGLTTFDGFPRSDIDVPQIRTTRARIIHLRNDYKDLMNRIEKGLHAHHAAQAAAPSGVAQIPIRPPVASFSSTAQPDTLEVAFAKVDEVSPNSPAEEAGLRVDDQVLRFDTVDWKNHENLRKVAEAVSRNEGRPIQVKISRSGEELSFQLTPRRDWGGRGLLGCHLLPVRHEGFAARPGRAE